MEIALINPLTEVDEMRELYEHHENLGLGLIAGLLRKNNFQVVIYDLRVHCLTEKEVVLKLIEKRVSLVGISVNYVTLPSALKIAQYLKLHNPHQCIVVFGGEHATYLDAEILRKYSSIDFIMKGEGEESFLAMAKSIRERLSPYNCKGVSYFINNTYVTNRNSPPKEELDDLPFADRSIAKYARKKGIPIEIGILAQRGCPFPCSFCNANRFLGNETTGIRYRSAKNIADEMEFLLPLFYKKHKYLRFYDATFITQSDVNRRWVLELCRELEKRDIKIPLDVFIRSDSFRWERKEEIKLLKRLRNVGMISTYLGFEAGDDESLSVYNKKVNSNQSLRAFLTLQSLGMSGSTNGIITFH